MAYLHRLRGSERHGAVYFQEVGKGWNKRFSGIGNSDDGVLPSHLKVNVKL